ncbi:MAG: T9SS type A sorting domain-containing protein [Candidatus Marinimicrobia bacterium]|nr:T9SS type A sorting domain-containing protein [Candidatus Neomarinimicrobiota bacterium]
MNKLKRLYCLIIFLFVAKLLFPSAVSWDPPFPSPGDSVKIYYNIIEGTLPDNATRVYIHIGYNNWSNIIQEDPLMDKVNDSLWSYVYNIPEDAFVIDFVFTDDEGNWDNNGGYGVDYHIPLYFYWEPYQPRPYDTVRIVVNKDKGGKIARGIAWHIVSNGRSLMPLKQYWPEGTQILDDMFVESQLPSSTGNYELILGPFNSCRQIVDEVKFKIHWNDGSWDPTYFEISFDYTTPQGAPEITFLSPSEGDTIESPVDIKVSADAAEYVEVWLGADSVGKVYSNLFEESWSPSRYVFGNSRIVAKAEKEGKVSLKFLDVYVLPQIVKKPVPEGISDGTTINGNEVTFALYAPFKEFVALKGNFNWEYPDGELMYLSGDTLWWLNKTLSNGEYYYQYNLEGKKLIADPWSKDVEWKIPGTDFESSNYNDAKTVFYVGKEPFKWTDTNFVRPSISEIIIYELHIGDFSGNSDGKGTYKDVIEKIEEGYFDTLGINVVEIMPVNEFEGDKSWGYNPSFYLAPESSYGTPDELKLMINKFHEHGIAVLMDVVFNHMWGSAPLFQLYQPLNNWDYRAHDYEHCPYFHNRESPWGYKLEHWHGLTPAGYPRRTWKYVTDCLKMWVEEYHIDGFRFDHTEGIGWDSNGKNGMNFYASYLEELDPDLIVIAEEDNAYNINNSYVDAGWNFSYYHMTKSNLQEIYDAGFYYGNMNQVENEIKYDEQGFMHQWGPVNYCESHDETRIIYEATHYQEFSRSVAVKKSMLGAVLLFTSTGTPMIYHGQEFGQDGTSRTSGGYIQSQPLKWYYLETEDGHRLFEHYRRLIWLRKNWKVLQGKNLDVVYKSSTQKLISYWRGQAEEKIVVVLNFSPDPQIVDIEFPYPGTWYEFTRDDTVFCDDGTLDGFEAEAYTGYIFCNFKNWESLAESLNETTSIPRKLRFISVYPNPFNSTVRIDFEVESTQRIELSVYDILGREIRKLVDKRFDREGAYSISWDGKNDAGRTVDSGVYFLRLKSNRRSVITKLLYVK